MYVSRSFENENRYDNFLTISTICLLPGLRPYFSKSTIPKAKNIPNVQYKQENTTSKMISQFFSPKVLLYGSKLESVTFGSQNIADDSTELHVIFYEIDVVFFNSTEM